MSISENLSTSIRVASVEFDGETWSITYYPWQADEALAQIRYLAHDPNSNISIHAAARLAAQVIRTISEFDCPW